MCFASSDQIMWREVMTWTEDPKESFRLQPSRPWINLFRREGLQITCYATVVDRFLFDFGEFFVRFLKMWEIRSQCYQWFISDQHYFLQLCSPAVFLQQCSLATVLLRLLAEELGRVEFELVRCDDNLFLYLRSLFACHCFFGRPLQAKDWSGRPPCIAANAPDVQSEYETGGPKWRSPSESPTWNVRAIQVNPGHPATLSKETEKRKNGEREKHKVLKLVELDQDHGQQSHVRCVVHFQMSRWQSLQSKVLLRQNWEQTW